MRRGLKRDSVDKEYWLKLVASRERPALVEVEGLEERQR